MKKWIIANWGGEKQGKSESLKEIARYLITGLKGATTNPTIIDYSRDIEVVITFGSIKIAVVSQGDPGTNLLGRLKSMADQGCDIIFCATRPRGKTEEAVYEIQKIYSYEAIWITNYRSDDEFNPNLNELFAKQIFDLSLHLITDII